MSIDLQCNVSLMYTYWMFLFFLFFGGEAFFYENVGLQYYTWIIDNFWGEGRWIEKIEAELYQ